MMTWIFTMIGNISSDQNEIFTVTREVKDKVSGEIQTTADYSELGILLIVVTLLTLILPILFVIIINNSKYKTSE